MDHEKLELLELNPDAYPGGIGIWGAVQPVFDTSGRIDRPGVHVHARSSPGGEKDIDQTFDVVTMTAQTDLFHQRSIRRTQAAAVAHYVSQFLGFDIECLFCIKCGELHLDAGYFATRPHKKHLCHACGEYFSDTKPSVSNPIAYFRKLSDVFQRERRITKSTKPLEISQSDYPGGIQIWASNPALIWTAERQEEQGIHIHAYTDENGPPKEDETFGHVMIDGYELAYKQIAQLMAQRTLPHLQNKVVSIACPVCGEPHFDEGVFGVTPHKRHACVSCNTEFQNPGRRKLVVSNPIIDILGSLRRAKPTSLG